MAESDIPISEMTNGTFSAGAIFPAIQPSQQSATGYANVKLSGADIGDGIGRLEFPLRLETENKTIFGAINEAANNIINFLPIDTASGVLASFPDGANGVPLQSLILNVKPYQAGTGDPSPSNVRPISGFTQAVITRTGANIWDEEWEVGGINVSTGADAAFTDRIRSKNYIPCNPDLTIYVKASSNYISVVFYDANKNYISGAQSSNPTRITPPNTAFIRFSLGSDYGTTYNNDISINYPATDTSYHAYTATTRTASFGQTLYGATINPLTGEGNITRVIVDLGNLDWGRHASTGNFFCDISSLDRKSGTSSFCSAFKFISDVTSISDVSTNYTIAFQPSNNRLIVKDTDYSDVTFFKTAMSGVMLVCELATPVPITITPIENINTLYGANNIFQDAGDISVTYKADIGLYIAKKTA